MLSGHEYGLYKLKLLFTDIMVKYKHTARPLPMKHWIEVYYFEASIFVFREH